MNKNGLMQNVPKLAHTLAVILAIVIAFLSLLPGSELPAQNVNDKVKHFAAYGLLTLLALICRAQREAFLFFLIIVGYGFLLEIFQGVMPFGRSASWLDGLANAIGALFGTMIALALGKLIKPSGPK